MTSRRVFLVSIVCLVGCGRVSIDLPDTGAADTGVADATVPDTGADTARVDASSPDAFDAPDTLEVDAADDDAVDARVDAAREAALDTGADVEACVARAETCNLLDDDCNGRVDDSGDASVCPPSCVVVLDRGRRYVHCRTMATWAGARSTCGALGDYDLVVIDDAFEDAFVRRELFTAETIWIGAHDESVEGRWDWVDGRTFWRGDGGGVTVGSRYAGWVAGEPGTDVVGSPWDCATYSQSAAGWAAEICADRRAFFCEETAPPMPVERCNNLDDDGDTMVDEGSVCPFACLGGNDGSGREYALCGLIISARKTFLNAQTDCESIDMDLVAIDSSEEQAFVVGAIATLSIVGPWTGGSDTVVPGEWRWRSGQQYWQGGPSGTPVGGAFSQWQSGQPIVPAGCMFAATDGWYSDACTVVRPYICEAR